MIFLLLLLPLVSFAQEGEIVPGTEFDFAVALQYDVEPLLIGQGVYLGATNFYWGSLPDSASNDLSIAYGSLDSPDYSSPVWTNYDTNGLPPEVLAPVLDSVIATNGNPYTQRFGLTGLADVRDANKASQTVPVVPLPFMTSGPQTSTFEDVAILPDYDPLGPIDLQTVRSAFRYGAMPAGYTRSIYANIIDGFWSLLDKIVGDRASIRNFFGYICTTIALLHYFWIAAVVFSGIFRAVVAGLTGVPSGGGK